MIAALRLSLLAIIFLLPIMTPFQSYGYELSKILFFIFLTSLSGFLWLWLVHQKKIKLRWNAIKITSLIFVVILLFTSVLGTDTMASLTGKEPYFQGWVVYSYLWFFSLMVSSIHISLKTWSLGLVLSGFLVAFVAIRQFVEINFLGYYIPTYAGRVVSTFGQPNFYGGFLLLTLPFMTRKGWWIMTGFLMIVVAIILSQSRTALILLSGLMMIWLIKQLKGKKQLVFGVALGTIILAITLSVFLSRLLFVSNPDLTKESVENRVYIWPLSWQLILQKPFLGYGLENISTAFTNYFEENKHALFEENLKVQPFMFGLKDLILDRSHNYLLDLSLFSGVLGLATWLILIFTLFKSVKSKILLTGLITYLVWVQFQNQSVVHLIYFWLLVGLIDQDGT